MRWINRERWARAIAPKGELLRIALCTSSSWLPNLLTLGACTAKLLTEILHTQNCAIALFHPAHVPENCAIVTLSENNVPENCVIELLGEDYVPENCVIVTLSENNVPENCAIELVGEDYVTENCNSITLGSTHRDLERWLARNYWFLERGAIAFQQDYEVNASWTEGTYKVADPINSDTSAVHLLKKLTMIPNVVSAQLSDEDQAAIMAAITTIREKLPFSVSLTPSERRAKAKMGDKTRAFVEKSMEFATHHPDYLPRLFDLEEMRRDVELFAALYPVLMELIHLQELVQDTYTTVGQEAYAAARVVYKSAKVNGRGAGLDASIVDMGRRFAPKTSKSQSEMQE